MARQERAAAPRAPSSARIADGIVEAGWLLAVALVPVFFNIHSGRPFEPDKTALLRLLALVMAAAGLARFLEERLGAAPRAAAPPWRESPLLVCAAVYLASTAVSTLFSIQPRLSTWGSHTRLEGLVTLLAHLTVFVSLATRLRRRPQAERLLDAVVAASVPVCVYGIVQRLGRDPLDWLVPYQEWRVSTTLGNPIFAGAYLTLAFTATLGGLAWWWGRRGDAGRAARVFVYTTAAVLQIGTLGLTGSRGPWLGAAAAVAGLLLIAAAVKGRRRLAAATLAAGLSGLTFVGLLNVPGGPLEPLRQGAVLGRLGRLFADPEGRNPGDRARVLVWRGALRLATLGSAIVVPGRGPDGAAGLRPFVGYGPETFQGVFGAVYDPAFAQAERRNPDVSPAGASTFHTRVPDRSHNETLDSLVLGGLVGLLAHLLIHAAAQYTGLRALGLLATRRDRLWLSACAAAGAGGAVGAAGLGLSWSYVGAALPLGLVGGWVAFVLAAALRRRDTSAPAEALLVAGLTAALLGHFVEIQFGPAVVTDRLYFWALAGLLAALARHRPATPESEAEAGPALEGVRAGLPAAALGIVIVYGFAGLKAGGGGRTAYGIVALLLGATIAAWVALATRRARAAAAAAAIAAGIAAAYGLVHLRSLAATAQVRSMAELTAALRGHYTLVALLTVGLATGAGAALGWPGRARIAPPGLLRLFAAIALALALAAPGLLAGVNADVMRHFASTFLAQGRLPEAVSLFEEATRLAPADAAHFQGLGEALLAGTRLREAPGRTPELLRRAEAAFLRARALDPLAPDHTANLARLARRRAELEADPAAARRQAEEAARHYADATALVPGNTLLLDESAELDFQRRGDFAAAEAKLLRSRALDPSFEYTHAALGDLYLARARAEGSREDFRRAAAAYLEAASRRRSLKALVSLAACYRELGETAQAVRTLLEALAMAPPVSVSWALHEQLAALYAAQADRARALHHARLALAQAPKPDRSGLESRLRTADLLP